MSASLTGTAGESCFGDFWADFLLRLEASGTVFVISGALETGLKIGWISEIK